MDAQEPSSLVGEKAAAAQRAAALKEGFRRRYHQEARVFRAPGRMNLIGEHTDYNDGFVMPVALSLYTWVAAALRTDRRLQVYSENFSQEYEFELDDPDPRPRNNWSDYVRGVAIALQRAGYPICGANLFIQGEVPVEAGLSSSAALEVATGYALQAVAGVSIDLMALAHLAQQAENEFVGMRCGIMDQFTSCYARKSEALLLDCRSLSYRFLPLFPDIALVVCDTMVKRALAGGEYNQRRAECESAVQHLARALPHVRALRDVSLSELEDHGQDLPAVVFKRCRHVIGENARVLQAASALEEGNVRLFGELMTQSHRSLREDYEVSCTELDLLVELANSLAGVFGARMTGGGFGGCTVNLVREEAVPMFRRAVAKGYEDATGRQTDIYVCRPAQGVAEITEGG